MNMTDLIHSITEAKLHTLERNGTSVTLTDMMPRYVTPRGGMKAEEQILRFARTSVGGGLKTVAADTSLIKYLWQNKHTSPFESIQFSIRIEAPKFVIAHILRHRTGSYNELSTRYTEIGGDQFWVPDEVRVQNKSNKQHTTNLASPEVSKEFIEMVDRNNKRCYDEYHRAIDMGVCRELARTLLPVSMMSTLNMTMNLKNLLHLVGLRIEAAAQKETRDVAEGILQILRFCVPLVVSEWEQSINGLWLSPRDISHIAHDTPLIGQEMVRYQGKMMRLDLCDDDIRMVREMRSPFSQ